MLQVFGAWQVASFQSWSPKLPSVSLHTLQVFGAWQVASFQSWPNALPSVSPHTLQVFAVVQVASAQSWPNASPSVAWHTLQVFAVVQVASAQSWPNASPSISPHTLQVFGSVQVAFDNSCGIIGSVTSSSVISPASVNSFPQSLHLSCLTRIPVAVQVASFTDTDSKLGCSQGGRLMYLIESVCPPAAALHSRPLASITHTSMSFSCTGSAISPGRLAGAWKLFKADVPVIISVILQLLPTVNLLKSNSLKPEQFLNMLLIFVTLFVLKLSPNSKLSKLEQPWNIAYIVVTFLVSKLLMSKLLNFPHPENILYISVTFSVLKLLKSNVSKLEQLLNIDCIFVTFSVLKLLKSNVFKLVQLLNI